jgi:hypothetical protein
VDLSNGSPALRLLPEPEPRWSTKAKLGTAFWLLVFTYGVVSSSLDQEHTKRQHAMMLEELRRISIPPETERHPWWRTIDNKINDCDWGPKPNTVHLTTFS